MAKNNDVVEKNLELMTGTDKKSMHYLIFNESMDAGMWRGFPCTSVSFIYNPATGEISEFIWSGYSDSMIPKGLVSDNFRIAVNTRRRDTRYRIVDYAAPEDIDLGARVDLEATVKEYNKRHGFEGYK